MIKRSALLVFVSFFIACNAFCLDGKNDFFSYSGEIRFRFEYDDNFTLKGYSPDEIDRLLLERVRLNFLFDFKKGGKVFLQLQDAHPYLTQFGDKDFKVSSPIKDTLDIRQLFYEAQNIGGTNFDIKIGRQQISYGDQRVFGPGSWGNTGRYAWDAVKATYKGKIITSDFWIGKYLLYKNDVFPDHPVNNFLTFVNYNEVKNLPFSLDFFYVLKHNTNRKIKDEHGENGNLTSHSIGFQIVKSFQNNLQLGSTCVYQFGKHSSDTIKAYGVNAKILYTFDFPTKPQIGMKYTFGSGDSNPKDGTYETFDGVFGGADLYYGFMNLFFWSNIRDVEANFAISPSEKLSLSFDCHRFSLASKRDGWYLPSLVPNLRDTTGRSGTAIGTEYDLRFIYTLKKQLSILCGVSKLCPLDFIKLNLQKWSNANWYYIQATFSF